MKTKLLAAFILFSIAGYSQNPISTFYGGSGAYVLGIVATPLNETAAGPNLVWNFDQIGQSGEAVHIYRSPTAPELISYPGTTSVLETTSTINNIESVSQLYTANPAGNVSIKAIKNETLELNYITNNANLGTFPLNYGYTNTDSTAGTYVYDTYSGTFTGTITTSVDAYGTLTSSIGNIPANTPVTRLKTVQNVSLNYFPFSGVGTGTQTTYSYYWDTGDFDVIIPVLNTSTTYINVPLLSVNETIIGIEAYAGNQLGINHNELQTNQIQIVPNPVNDFINIQVNNNQMVTAATVCDMAGRIVFNSNSGENLLNVSFLQKGVYFVTVQTDSGNYTQKIIKK